MSRLARLCTLIAIALTGLGFLRTPEPDTPEGAAYFLEHFNSGVIGFSAALTDLRDRIRSLQPGDSADVSSTQAALARCRQAYKVIEAPVEYFFESRIRIFNLPSVYEIEEPYREYQHPIGMQVVEAMLFGDSAWLKKAEMLGETEVMLTTAASLPALLAGKAPSEAQILECLRLELYRIAATGITGYDAPELRTSIPESRAALEAFRVCIAPWLAADSTSDSTAHFTALCIDLLEENSDFNRFDRLAFLTRGMLPLQTWMDRLIRQRGSDLNTTALHYESGHFLSPGFLHPAKYAPPTAVSSEELVALGRSLFFDQRLSARANRSCASCHEPEKYFTDGMSANASLDGSHALPRNTPSVLYAGFQRGQFLDSRSPSLEAQIPAVLLNHEEMAADTLAVQTALRNDKVYRKLFHAAFPDTRPSGLFTLSQIAAAIAAFERSLPVMTSAFDQYIAGNTSAMAPEARRGFNLFMGKAGCGTCHFLPLFNGLLPPAYEITELESLGLTATGDFEEPLADTDSGRFRVFPIAFYIGAFKTPTVRNAAKTGPYMHNGAFNTLGQVIQFYNRGGGKGMGLAIPYQTLSDKQLHLSAAEKSDLIAFMNSLTDEPMVHHVPVKPR